MKRLAILLSALALIAAAASHGADKGYVADSVTFRDGKLTAMRNGDAFSPTNSVTMPLGILVSTNATFTVNEGPKRKLKEGQTLRKDGMLASPDGSLVPVVDHIAMLKGKPTLTKDGVASPIKAEVKLKDGSRIYPDGTIVYANGRRTRLMDGQLFKVSGEKIPATDTITFKDGVVTLQKDGSQIKLAPRRTFMMDDGTLVYADGRIKSKSGTIRQLADGETVEVPGVRRR